ncbi:chromosome segregation protein SMC [Candidatus Micrarchaeota archaeon]|nr:chromosome segregation protein SMC [Candidatus Micrarchaeota archaeon]
MHISSMKLRGFKSFKKADLELPPDFICLAGPNGSGKTNVLDAVRFGLGEKSLKSLRARKVSDLICHNSKYAEVIINFQDDKKYELRRAIREDGKIKYVLNGKTTTRSAILELLKKYNLDNSGRNIIAQGDTQRIVEISGKERRGIVDAVAGISEFEEKKKEAMKELEVVEGRMRDANLVLGERTAFLRELASEKERALKYSSSVDTVKRTKATLIGMELEKATRRKEKLEDSLLEAKKGVDDAKAGLAKVESQVKEEETKKEKVSAEIGAKEERERLLREIEKTKAELSAKKEALQESSEGVSKALSSIESLKGDIETEKGILDSLSKEEAALREKMAPLENLRLEHKESEAVSKIRRELSALEAERSRIREQMLILRGEIEKSQSLIGEKQRALDEEDGGEAADLTGIESEIEGLKEKLSGIISSQDALFKREKELNTENAELDRNLLSLREKVATLRAQTSASVRNPALSAISELKESGEINGIHGTVADLIKFKPDYSKAIDAAGGSRLLYVVVDSADVAIKAVSYLKKTGRGRATFIPLREVSCPSVTAVGGMGPLLNYIEFSPKYSKALEFVFGNTLLVEDAKEAKSIGVGKERMVTIDGDLFDKSGIITGGKTRGGVASAAQLTKMEAELESTKERKSGILDDLSQIREEMGNLRREKVEAEIAIRKREVELDSFREKMGELKKKQKRKEEAQQEIGKLNSSLEHSGSKLSSYEKNLSEAEAKLLDTQKKLESEIEQESSANEMMEKEREEKTKFYTSLRAQADSKKREFEVRTDGLADKERRLGGLTSTHKDLVLREKTLSTQISRGEDDLHKLEERMGASDRAIRKLMEKIKEFEAKLVELGGLRGKFNSEMSKHEKTLTVAEVEINNLDTRIADLSAELGEFEGVEQLEGSREELLEKMKAAESLINNLGNVNLAAPEMYLEKEKELAEMNEKIERLRVEKDAIIEMISGIEERKKEAFFDSFHAVDKEFRKLFKLIDLGEGYLYLDKPSTPFESGLYIKLKRGNREHSLESLSGGEKSLVALMFVFALQFYKPSPFYVLDEVDAPLDKVNTKNLAKLLKELAPRSQFLVVSHNDIMMGMASAMLGVSRVDGVSKIVGVKLGKGDKGLAVEGPDSQKVSPAATS